MGNFPQSFEPVNSDSILEQFLQLKGNVNRVNEAMADVEQTADSAFEKASDNEASIQVLENDVQTLSTGLETAEQNLSKCVRFDVQSLTDAQKAQARSNIGAGSAVATSVLVNGETQTQIEFDSDPQTQIDSVENEISALDSRLVSAEDDIITNAGAISALDGKALKTPMSAPAENEIPTINTANAQVNVTVGDGLKIENNELQVDENFIDSTPTQNSDNLVSSGGVYNALRGKQDNLIAEIKTYTTSHYSFSYPGDWSAKVINLPNYKNFISGINYNPTTGVFTIPTGVSKVEIIATGKIGISATAGEREMIAKIDGTLQQTTSDIGMGSSASSIQVKPINYYTLDEVDPATTHTIEFIFDSGVSQTYDIGRLNIIVRCYK